MGRMLSDARQAALLKGGSRERRALGMAMIGAFGAATFALTTVVTTFPGAHAIL